MRKLRSAILPRIRRSTASTISGPARAVFAASLFLTSPSVADSIQYTFTPRPEVHAIDVQMTWHTTGRTESTLAISENWASVRQPVAFLEGVEIAGADEIRDANHQWHLRHEFNTTIGLSYRVRTGHRSFDWDRIYLPICTHRFFHGIGHTFLIAPECSDSADAISNSAGAQVAHDVTIQWNLPADWNTAACPLGAGVNVSGSMSMADLRQSVFLAGAIDVTSAEVAGSPVTVAMHDLFRFDVDDLLATASSIVRAERAFMQDDRFPPYLITVIPVGDLLPRGSSRRSGTGLYRGCALFLPPASEIDDDVRFLFAHELFHYWNGRILQREEPEELVYWFSEGLTDYFAFRILLAEHRESAAALARRLNRVLRRYYTSPVIGAPNEAIRDGFWQERQMFQELPYQRGFLLGLRWDFLSRERGCPDGMDGWFRSMVAKANHENFRLSPASIRASGIDHLGPWFGEEFDRFTDGREPIILPDGVLGDVFERIDEEKFDFSLGFDLVKSRDEGAVCGLERGSPADAAGLREGDRLLGWDIVMDDPDREVELKVRRSGEILTIRYYPRGRSISLPQFKLKPEPP